MKYVSSQEGTTNWKGYHDFLTVQETLDDIVTKFYLFVIFFTSSYIQWVFDNKNEIALA